MANPKGNPQNLRPAWKKGESGNPKGKPPTPAELRQKAQCYSVESLERLVSWMQSDNPKASVTAADKILERGFGKPEQPIAHSGEIAIPVDRASIVKRLIQRQK